MGAKTHGKSSEFAARTERRKRTENRGARKKERGERGRSWEKKMEEAEKIKRETPLVGIRHAFLTP